MSASGNALFAQQTPNTSKDQADWTRFVPGDARFYVELRDLAGIRERFRALGVWPAVRELSERGESSATSRPWQRRTEELLGLSDEAAITELLGRRAALIAAESSQWQNGVVIAELGPNASLPQWLQQWSAQRLSDEGPVRRYALSGGITLAVLGQTLIFGPAGDSDSLWGRSVLLLAGRKGPTLAGRSEYASLRARMTAEHSGLLYATWREGDPSAFAGCSRLLFGVSVTPTQITCELHGQKETPRAPPLLPADLSLVAALPANSLAVWTSAFDPARLVEGVQRGRLLENPPLADLLLSAYSMGATEASLGRFGPSYTIVVGKDSGRKAGEPSLPPVTLIIPVDHEAAHMERMDLVIGFYADAFAIMSTLRSTPQHRIEVQRRSIEGADVHFVALGPVLAKRVGLDLLRRVEVCWTTGEGRLYLSSSSSHIEEILRAAKRKSPRLGDAADGPAWPAKSDSSPVCEGLLVSGEAVSEAISQWLEFVQRAHPEALQPQWWKAWALVQLERSARLGVGLANDKAGGRRAMVREVADDSPAIDQLQYGDVIVAAAGRPLVTPQPAQEVMERYRSRGAAKTFALQVIRDGQTHEVVIQVPPAPTADPVAFDPVTTLRQLAILSHPARSVTAWRRAGGPDRLDVQAVIRWGTGGAPIP